MEAQEITKLRNNAARKIQLLWLRYKNKQMFKLLKTTICAAEYSLSAEILRKIIPKEAHFFKNDSFMNLKIRFRFGGSEYPPYILFKIYVDSQQCKVRYVNGKKTITTTTDAASDAVKQMGYRKYYDQLLRDDVLRLQNGVTEEDEVVTIKDYMHVSSVLDELAPEYGGKANGWRKLGSQSVPRFTVFQDVMEFLVTKQMTDRLKFHMPLLTMLPSSQEVRREQLEILTQLDVPKPQKPINLPKQTGLTSRRSNKAKQKAAKMRQTYIKENTQDDINTTTKAPPVSALTETSGSLVHDNNSIHSLDSDLEETEHEAELLYQWTKELTMDELISPRHSVLT